MSKSPPFSMRFISPFYQGAWRVARPFLGKHKRLKEGWEQRLVPDNWVEPFLGKTVWIQAASGGEAYLLVKLAKQMRDDWQGTGSTQKLRILATTCTRQGMDVLEKGLQNDPGQKQIEYLLRYFPLDEPKLMRSAIEQANPSQIVLLETELWPGLLMAAWQEDIPVVLLNGRITPKSMSGYKLLPATLWKTLAPKKILAVSELDAERYSQLFGSEIVELMSNIKFDLLGTQTFESSSDINADSLLSVALFASVRKQEADQVVEAIQRLKNLASESIVVIVPRHLHHVSAWQGQVSLKGLKPVLRTEFAEDATPLDILSIFAKGTENSVLIWDKFGELKALYNLSRATYVGGSLVALGGQNFLEAMATGLEPCIGPYWSNFAWAGDEILEMAKHVKDPDTLATVLAGQLAIPAPKNQVKERFERNVQIRQGGTKKASAVMIEMLF